MPSHDDGRRRFRVALVAHDDRQAALVAFALRHRDHLANWVLLAPAPTAEKLRDATGLRVHPVPPGPRGCEVALATELVAGELDALIFLRDPLATGVREPDAATLLHLADVHTVAAATNLASAECLVRALAPETRLAVRR